MNKFIWLSIVFGIISLVIGFFANNGWIYIPALMDYLFEPIIPNIPVHWESNAVPSDPSKPNVIVIIVDDMGYNDISFYGGGFHGIQTPNIDSIGKQGVSFSNAYSGHATCAPSRASLLTGKFATKMGYEYTPVSDVGSWVIGKYMKAGSLKGVYHGENAQGLTYANMSLPKTERTMAQEFKDNGYRTLQIGKWHVGATNDTRPLDYGFDEYLGFSLIARYLGRGDPRSMDCMVGDMLDEFLWANARYYVVKDKGPAFEPNAYLTDYLADEAVAAITANKNNPFFMYMAFTAVHTPLQALKEDYDALPSHITEHCDRVYGAMIVSLDRAIGVFLYIYI